MSTEGASASQSGHTHRFHACVVVSSNVAYHDVVRCYSRCGQQSAHARDGNSRKLVGDHRKVTLTIAWLESDYLSDI